MLHIQSQHSNLVSFLGKKGIQFFIRQVSVSFINLPLPAICLHLFWRHGQLTRGRGLHLHSGSPSRRHSTGANHRSGATHLTGRCLVPSGSSLTSRSRCSTRCLSTSAVCSRCLCPTWSGMAWSFPFNKITELEKHSTLDLSIGSPKDSQIIKNDSCIKVIQTNHDYLGLGNLEFSIILTLLHDTDFFLSFVPK